MSQLPASSIGPEAVLLQPGTLLCFLSGSAHDSYSVFWGSCSLSASLTTRMVAAVASSPTVEIL